MDSRLPEPQEVTSDYGDSITTSEFTSDNTVHPLHFYEHGRRYQGFIQGRYGMPNDDAEQLREGVKHKLYVDYILGGGLFLAPIGDNPQKIVDLGTGFGFWALDVAERFPSARIIGTDLSPVQPHWTPPNVEFRVEDLDDEFRPWTNIYHDADLIHLRFLLPTIRWPRTLLQRCLENLKPGGWAEVHDIVPVTFSDDGTAGDDHPVHALYRLIEGPFSRLYGWNFQVPSDVADMLRELGFVNVTIHAQHDWIDVWAQKPPLQVAPDNP
ncbi:methyltransferase [Hirsutella rhossiliensis]|uniref:Methyltransferase domain-containing protein n=1 Tax=Hirsutella rhossiliensis TaxID=111463 RepID=A0A9P8N2N0_9HYPO|nr:methyltransferase domain-containing protein [Hirsutella rhossiliensis]KAH0965497.1 methyltransferase domain-containing protein [Hirsutella rhossiliensis]